MVFGFALAIRSMLSSAKDFCIGQLSGCVRLVELVKREGCVALKIVSRHLGS